jgi:hypothetical protein
MMKEQADWPDKISGSPSTNEKEVAMFSSNSPFSGLVPVILVLVLIGGLATLALSGSDLTNFMTNRVKADALAQQTAAAAQKTPIDVETYRLVQTSQAQAQVDKMKADSDYYQKSLDLQTQYQQKLDDQNLQLNYLKTTQEMQTSHITQMILTSAGAIALLLVALGIAVYMVSLTLNRLLTNKKVKKAGSWQDPAWKKQQIENSRRREQASRASSMNPFLIPVELPIRSTAYAYEVDAKQRLNRKEADR